MGSEIIKLVAAMLSISEETVRTHLHAWAEKSNRSLDSMNLDDFRDFTAELLQDAVLDQKAANTEVA